MKKQTNNLRWQAELMVISSSLDEQDRPIISRIKKRDVFYHCKQKLMLCVALKSDGITR